MSQHFRTNDNASLQQILDLAQKIKLLADAHDQLSRLTGGRSTVVAVCVGVIGQQPLIDEEEAQLLALSQPAQTLRLGAQLGENAHDLVQHGVVGVGQLMVRQLLAPIDVQLHGSALDGCRLAGRPVQMAGGVVGVQLTEQAVVGVEELAELAQLAFTGNG